MQAKSIILTFLVVIKKVKVLLFQQVVNIKIIYEIFYIFLY